MDFKPLQYIWEPAVNGNGYTLLLLHGTGGDETDLLPLAAELGKGYHVLSVRGNVSEHGMPRFFRRLSMGVFDEKDVHFRTHELVHFLKELSLEKGFDVDKLIPVGYSNGANIAGAILMLYPELLAGAVLFRPMQPLQGIEDPFETEKAQPVFMSGGLQDATLEPGATESYATLLEANGFAVKLEMLDTGHQLTRQDVTLAAQWLAQSF
ncbi:phospholipase/carboxylesterase [Chitinophaga jiangningensis]|uniref:Phospholipase/carboxylesterase n=1 Tax=Chitinophaga jiangningensis TaxID=1419482 RepID=A0A1M7AIQ6_9BACT|nr:alpha/beta hydrolase [Chitinophaga jiangningensis]SHL42683.1 phospholipase/carboxylesterase [Chitinophaga jiangningensis]